MTAALLLLADGRFPAGGHAHSHGLEAMVASGRVRDLDAVERVLIGRLRTAGLMTAAFAVAARDGDPDRLDAELDARTASPALRTASRRQGRALLRAARVIWPDAPWVRLPAQPHQPIVLGFAAAAAGLTDDRTALAAVHGVATATASAALRLLGLDPFAVQALLIRLAPELDALAAEAVKGDLARGAAPLTDLSAELHATWEVRLFAS
ncbi:urease accessory protein UreF [Hamadaea tsunoensis]|uniref:urease accessory protein UreF n=1 Tax=Hamadaea tsunoensis TaxID=53368 RepID=UPI0004087A94|nr:urease accessory UreF family protein [Hamadaea tsunoensis]